MMRRALRAGESRPAAVTSTGTGELAGGDAGGLGLGLRTWNICREELPAEEEGALDAINFLKS